MFLTVCLTEPQQTTHRTKQVKIDHLPTKAKQYSIKINQKYGLNTATTMPHAWV